MTVSVVMATHNGEKYVLKQLESLYTQKHKPDEVIICDDSSMDRTVEIINKYIARKKLQKSWHLFINEEKLGFSNNCFNALEKAKGDYIFFCAQDDVWFPDKISKMVEIMDGNEISLLCSEYTPFGQGVDVAHMKHTNIKAMLSDGSLEKLKLNKNTFSYKSEGCVTCFRKSFYDRVKQYRVSKCPYDEFMWKMALADDSCYIYHKPLYKRRFYVLSANKNKQCDTRRRMVNLKKSLNVNEQVLLFMKENNKSEETIRFFEKNSESIRLRLIYGKDKKIQNALAIFLNFGRNYSRSGVKA